MSDEEKPAYGPFRIMPEEQAKRLEAADARATQIVINGSNQLREAREESARLRAVLEFYASRRTWRGTDAAASPASNDRGHRARKALGIVG